MNLAQKFGDGRLIGTITEKANGYQVIYELIDPEATMKVVGNKVIIEWEKHERRELASGGS